MQFVYRELRVSSVATTSAGGFHCATTTDYAVAPREDSVDGAERGAQGVCHVDITVKCEFNSRLFKGICYIPLIANSSNCPKVK